MSVELARRAVACKHWRWMPGVLTISGVRVEFISDTDAPGEYDLGHACGHLSSREELPDLTDPATLGCLLALVRKAWGEPGLYCVCHKGKWLVEWPDLEGDLDLDYARTEAEALVRALEAAP
jgi:hypothetical protein